MFDYCSRSRDLLAASHLSDVLTHILNDHFISSDWLHGKQTPVVDVGSAEPDLLFTELQRNNNTGTVFNNVM